MNKLLAIGGAIAAATLCFPGFSSAAPVLIKDSTGNLYLTGLTASTRVPVDYNFPEVRNVTSNACGLLLIRPSAKYTIGSTLHMGSTAINVATLPAGVIPKCTNGVLATPATANFKAPNGDVVIVGQTAYMQYPVTYDGTQTTRTVTVNACGFAKLSNNPKYPNNVALSVSGTALDPTTLAVSSPPLCRNGVKYTPAS